MSSIPLAADQGGNASTSTPTGSGGFGSTPRTLFQKLSESSHPVALVFFLAIRLGALLTYLLGLLFTSNFVLIFVLVVLLLAADFWNVKNVSGRLLVGLRWWNETSEDGQSKWVFETADVSNDGDQGIIAGAIPQRYINPIDSKVFWFMSYVTPAFWSALGLLAILKFQFLWLLLVAIALILTITNSLAFSRCDKFGKANQVASDILGNVSGGILSGIFSAATPRFFR